LTKRARCLRRCDRVSFVALASPRFDNLCLLLCFEKSSSFLFNVPFPNRFAKRSSARCTQTSAIHARQSARRHDAHHHCHACCVPGVCAIRIQGRGLSSLELACLPNDCAGFDAPSSALFDKKEKAWAFRRAEDGADRAATAGSSAVGQRDDLTDSHRASQACPLPHQAALSPLRSDRLLFPVRFQQSDNGRLFSAFASAEAECPAAVFTVASALALSGNRTDPSLPSWQRNSKLEGTSLLLVPFCCSRSACFASFVGTRRARACARAAIRARP